ncbi:MAG: nucleotidyl transferase AbiEii/AbiGii toxin family protein [Desulfotomaculales bacterium]
MGGSDAARGAPASRPPGREDLKLICRRFNELGVRYVLVGGIAMNIHGRPRMTHDVDFLVDPSPENVTRARKALLALPDGAARDIRPEDLLEYGVVRVADEVVVDLIARIGDVGVGNAGTFVYDLEGVGVVVADLETMIRTKQGLRDRDATDLRFLLAKKAAGVRGRGPRL